jgi:hypothetical protein
VQHAEGIVTMTERKLQFDAEAQFFDAHDAAGVVVDSDMADAVEEDDVLDECESVGADE